MTINRIEGGEFHEDEFSNVIFPKRIGFGLTPHSFNSVVLRLGCRSGKTYPVVMSREAAGELAQMLLMGLNEDPKDHFKEERPL